MNLIENHFYKNPVFNFEACSWVAAFAPPKNFFDSIIGANLIYLRNENCIFEKYLNIFYYGFTSAAWSPYTTEETKNFIGHKFYATSNLLRTTTFIFYGAIFRALQISATLAHNGIDNTKWHPALKFLASSAVLITPHLIMEYAFSYDMKELMLASILTYLASSLCNLFGTFRWGNLIREVNVLSVDKTFNINSLLSRGFLSSLINLGSTGLFETLLDIKYSSIDFSNFNNSKNAYIAACPFPNGEMIPIGVHEQNARKLLYLFNELGWLVGRYFVDMIFSSLSLTGFIHDLRDPLINFKRSIPINTSKVAEELNKRAQLNKTNVFKPNPSDTRLAHPSMSSSPTHVSSTIGALYPQTNSVSTNNKKLKKVQPKTSPAAIDAAFDADTSEEKFSDQEIIYISESKIPMVRIHGNNINFILYGVIDCRKISDVEKFTTSLHCGHAGGGAAIKYLPNLKKLELRPSATGNRVLGPIVSFFVALKHFLPLGEAIALDQLINPDGKFRAAVFNQEVKHDDIGKAGKAKPFL